MSIETIFSQEGSEYLVKDPINVSSDHILSDNLSTVSSLVIKDEVTEEVLSQNLLIDEEAPNPIGLLSTRMMVLQLTLLRFRPTRMLVTIIQSSQMGLYLQPLLIQSSQAGLYLQNLVILMKFPELMIQMTLDLDQV